MNKKHSKKPDTIIIDDEEEPPMYDLILFLDRRNSKKIVS